MKVMYHKDYWEKLRAICKEEVGKAMKPWEKNLEERFKRASEEARRYIEMAVREGAEFRRALEECEKNLEVDMGEKKFRVGERVRVREDIAKCHGYENVGDMAGRIVTIVRATEDGYNLKENGCLWLEKTLESTKPSSEELEELLVEYCQGRGCNRCEANEGNVTRCDVKQKAYVLANHDRIMKALLDIKAQKEQEKKEVFKPGDIAIDTRDGELIEVVSELSHKTRQRNATWLNGEGYKLGYRLVCRAEDRADGVKQD